MKPSDPRLFFAGRFLIIDLISIPVVGLFRLSLHDLVLVGCMLLTTYPFKKDHSVCLSFFLLLAFLVVPCSMQDLSSPARD